MCVWEGIKCPGRWSREGVGASYRVILAALEEKMREDSRANLMTPPWGWKKVFLSQYRHINVSSVEKHALLFFHNKYTNVCVNVNGCEWVCVAGDLWVCGNVYVCAFECLCHCVWGVHGHVRVGTCLSVREWGVSLTSEWCPLDGCLVHSAAAAKSLQSCPTVRPHRQQPIKHHCPWDSLEPAKL